MPSIRDDTSIIINELYPVVEASLNKNSRKFINNIAKFINSKHNEIFAIAPYDRIYFNRNDKDDFFKSLDLNEDEIVNNIVSNCFFWNIPYTPNAAKEAYVLILMCCIRYYLINNQSKNAELTTIYLTFTGKFYVSIHSHFWKFPPNKSVMDYVVNNMLSDKFDLKKEGTVFGAIRKLCITWLNTYKLKLISKKEDDIYDDRIGKLIQQLRDRERSFIANISNLYYEAYENKSYLNYETDNYSAEEFRLTDNDAAKAARITQSTIDKMTSQRVNMSICNKCKNENVKASEIREIVEGILADNENIPKLRRVINIIICDFMSQRPNDRVGGIEFFKYTTTAKPNTKSPLLIELKTTLINWLNDNSERYRGCKRMGTLNNFYKSLIGYLALMISSVSM